MTEGKRLNALIIEDSPDDADLLLLELRRNGYDVHYARVETAEELLGALKAYNWDIILSDFSLPSFNAPAALKLVQEHKYDLPFIIVSGTVGEETAVSSLKAGAHDFFTKNRLHRLGSAIERELREAQVRSEHRAFEEQLRKSEERFSKAFQASPVGISITTSEGRFLDANDYFLELMEYRKIDVIGRTSLELNMWVETENRDAFADMVFETGSVRNIETQARTRTGEIREIQCSFEVIELGGQPCVLTLIHDVTEQKRMADELRALYNATSHLFEANSVLNLGQQIVQAVVSEFGQIECELMLVDHQNNQMRRLSRAGNYQRVDADLHLDSKGLVPEAVRRESVIYVPDVTQDPRYLPSNPQTRSELVIPLRTRNGVVGVLDMQSVEIDAFPESSRRVITAFAERAASALESMDLYEKLNEYAAEMERRVEQRTAELQLAKERVETILDHSSDAIMLVGLDGVIQQANDAFTPMFGLSRDRVAGVPLHTLFLPEQIDALKEKMTDVRAKGRPARIDLSARRGDQGDIFEAEVAIAPVSEGGRTESLICSVRDITARKRAEQELRAALDKEKEVNELKSRFVSMVSHEFRTPLSTILSSSEVVKLYRDRMPEEKQVQHLDRIHSQVKRMVSLLDDVLVLSRAEVKGMVFAPMPTPLESFCQAIVEDMQFISRNHLITFKYDNPLSSVTLDRELVRQILTNLISNAIKYSPAGTTIQFDVGGDTGNVVFRVSDQGIGIPKEDQTRLFDAFHRARNSGQVQGTGLGLAIVKRAVDAHGGSVEFETVEGEGTTFTVTLPLGQDAGE